MIYITIYNLQSVLNILVLVSLMDGAEIVSFLLWVSFILCVYVFVRSVVCTYVHIHVYIHMEA